MDSIAISIDNKTIIVNIYILDGFNIQYSSIFTLSGTLVL